MDHETSEGERYELELAGHVELVAELTVQAVRFLCQMDGRTLVWLQGLVRH
jgi:hypothetical protein